MSVFLFLAGALSALGGIVAIAFGLPVKEFSFGNTLILSGVIGLMGGLILLGLGAAVTQLKRIAELIGARPLSRAGRGLEPFDQPDRAMPARVPFPPKRKPTPPREQRGEQMAEPQFPLPPAEPAVADVAEGDAAPSLRNPDVPLMADEDIREAPLSPSPAASPMNGLEFPEPPKPAMPSFEPEPLPETTLPPFEPRRAAVWPTDEPAEPEMPSRAESIPRAPSKPPAAAEPEQPEVRAVAILKSGVVDGMGYTLYVDGSIEAELPDGTLRFASIGELRAHLEQNS